MNPNNPYVTVYATLTSPESLAWHKATACGVARAVLNTLYGGLKAAVHRIVQRVKVQMGETSLPITVDIPDLDSLKAIAPVPEDLAQTPEEETPIALTTETMPATDPALEALSVNALRKRARQQKITFKEGTPISRATKAMLIEALVAPETE